MNIKFNIKNFDIIGENIITIPRQSADQVKRTPYKSIENLNNLIELFYKSHKEYINNISEIYNGYPLLNTPPNDFKYNKSSLSSFPVDRIVGSVLSITNDYCICKISELYPIKNITDEIRVTCDVLTNKEFSQIEALQFVLRKEVKLI